MLAAERNTRITELAEEGKSQREIAAEVDMSQEGVRKVINGDNKRNTSESSHPEPEPKLQDIQEQPTSRGVGVKYAHLTQALKICVC